MPRLSSCDPSTTVETCLAKGWGLSVRCFPCDRIVQVGLERLAEFPPGATLAEIAARAKCAVCGSDDLLVWTVNAHWHPGASGS